jgi:hypothetical protein
MSPQVGVGVGVVRGLLLANGEFWGSEGWRSCPDPPLPLREAADKVVLHTGKYEELIVCSHEIAASTAQLVAASKVRLH